MIYNYKKSKVRGIEYKYSAEWIHELETEEHWRLYWNQQKLIQSVIQKGENILEIGVGSGFTANYLRSKGHDITTMDIDSEKEPDIIANIVEYDFCNTYDHVLAFEVFEHIPYSEFQNILKKIRCSCRKNLFLSVPRNEKLWMSFCFKLPFIGKREFRIATLRRKIVEPAHFWEVDDGIVSASSFEETLSKNGLIPFRKIKRFSRLFYILQVSDNTIL